MVKAIFYIFIAISVYFTINLKPTQWYSGEVLFSNWRDRACDYSTNAIVTQWYNGGHPKYFREENFQKFIEDVNTKSSVTLGIDYYGLTSLSAKLINQLDPSILATYCDTLINSEVIVLKIGLK